MLVLEIFASDLCKTITPRQQTVIKPAIRLSLYTMSGDSQDHHLDMATVVDPNGVSVKSLSNGTLSGPERLFVIDHGSGRFKVLTDT